jgi:hypothetical protein
MPGQHVRPTKLELRMLAAEDLKEIEQMLDKFDQKKK